VLGRFASAHQITFPLLSDKGSAVIRGYGILNTNIPRTHMFYGIPFPGEYLIAPDGRVTDKVFLPSYQDGATASEVLLKDFGTGAGDDVVEVKSDETMARIRLSDSSAFSGQELAVAANFSIKPGWHIYGQPLPKGYVPTAISFDDAMVAQMARGGVARRREEVRAHGAGDRQRFAVSPDVQKNLLDDVLGQLAAADATHREGAESAVVAVKQRLEGAVVARANAREKGFVRNVGRLAKRNCHGVITTAVRGASQPAARHPACPE